MNNIPDLPESPVETAVRKSRFRRRVWCNFFGVALGLLVAAPVSVMLFDRTNPVTFIDGEIIPPVVRPGQTVEIVWHLREWKLGCDGEVAKRVVDAAGKIHEFKREPDTYHLAGPNGGIRSFAFNFEMPEGMADGPAYFTMNGERWCNRIQEHLWPITFTAPRVPFIVASQEVKKKIPERVVQKKKAELQHAKPLLERGVIPKKQVPMTGENEFTDEEQPAIKRGRRHRGHRPARHAVPFPFSIFQPRR